MAKQNPVPRPQKKAEYELVFASKNAEKGWRDLVATHRNAMVDVWDFLTRTPLERGGTNYPLKGSLATVTRAGSPHDRWQHKPTGKSSARIWFWVEGQTVFLEQVHTSHPSETK